MEPASKSEIESQLRTGVSESAVLHPVNLLEVLDGMEFPVSKMEMIAYAEDNNASEEIIDLLQAMPDDIYRDLRDVNLHSHDIEIISGSSNLFSSEESHDLPDEAERCVSDLNGMGRL